MYNVKLLSESIFLTGTYSYIKLKKRLLDIKGTFFLSDDKERIQRFQNFLEIVYHVKMQGFKKPEGKLT